MVLAARWRASLKAGPRILAVTIDHGLRSESAREANAVKRLAGELGLSHRTIRWSGRKPKTGLQQAARNARYSLLAAEAAKAGARHVLTAHTLDDQAETLLIRLARGSGLSGLAGMARETAMFGVSVVRPLLEISKARLIATLRVARVPYADDPSNCDPRFTRARLRELMPALAKEGVTAQRLFLLARRIARADAAIHAAVTQAADKLSLSPWGEGKRIEFNKDAYARLPDEIGLRLLGRAIGHVGDEGPVELGKLERLHRAVCATFGGRLMRRTLAGALVSAGPERLVVERAPARRLKNRRISALTTRETHKGRAT